MIKIAIPGFGHIKLAHAVFDYNGTLALDGVLLPEVKSSLELLSKKLMLHVVTADTFGRVKEQLESFPVNIHILHPDREVEQKEAYVQSLDHRQVVAVGNGNNDRDMLQLARIGIVVIGAEGCAATVMATADVIVRDIGDAFGLLLNPKRLKATLRF
jgi:P-type E1-E2 ATPase